MFFKYNWPVILWLIIILVLMGFPGNYFPKVSDFWAWLGPDKIIHLILFGILQFLLLRGFHKQYQFPRLRSYYVLYALLFGIIFGAFTELMQYYVFIGRNANIYDLIANIAGCILGWIAYYVLGGKLNKNIGFFNN